MVKKLFSSKATTLLFIIISCWISIELNSFFSTSAWINVLVFLILIVNIIATIALIYHLFSQKSNIKKDRWEEIHDDTEEEE
jgi:apolipoprotein N-acyltransferase